MTDTTSDTTDPEDTRYIVHWFPENTDLFAGVYAVKDQFSAIGGSTMLVDAWRGSFWEARDLAAALVKEGHEKVSVQSESFALERQAMIKAGHSMSEVAGITADFITYEADDATRDAQMGAEALRQLRCISPDYPLDVLTNMLKVMYESAKCVTVAGFDFEPGQEMYQIWLTGELRSQMLTARNYIQDEDMKAKGLHIPENLNLMRKTEPDTEH